MAAAVMSRLSLLGQPLSNEGLKQGNWTLLAKAYEMANPLRSSLTVLDDS